MITDENKPDNSLSGEEKKVYTILVVDDEEMIRSLIEKYAVFEGHKVLSAGDGMEAVEIARREKIDIIVLDVMMPVLDGFSTARKIREFSDCPIIMLSARGEEYDRIHGFEVGVDDYVVKPFSPKELLMRINAVMKRYERKGDAAGKTDAHEIYRKEGLKIDFSSRKVFVDDEEVLLAPKEYDLLFYLVRNRNLALSREQLIENVWDYDYFGEDRTLDTHIKLVRKALRDYAKFIVTLRGVGYRFED